MLLFALVCTLAGGIEGRIEDPTGGAVAGATISLRSGQQAQAAAARSGADGYFLASVAGAGAYVLRVEAPGFAPHQEVVRLTPAETVRVRIRLTLNPVSSEVTISAEAGTAVSLAEAAQRVTAINASEIEEKALTVLTEAARGQAGVTEQKTAPAMGAFMVRGLTGKNIAVYRDGVRYTTSAQRGGVSTFQNLVDPAWLESVEVVRGPNSAQFGSDSMGGAVHLVSRMPAFSAAGGSIRGEAGTFYQSAANAFGSQARLAWSGTRAAVSGALQARRVNRVRTGGGLDSHGAVTRFLGLPPDYLGPRMGDTAFTQYGGAVHAQVQISPFDHLSMHYERGQQDGARRYDQLLGGDGNLVADLRNLMLDFGYLRWQRLQAGWLDQMSASVSYTAQREERVNQGGQGNPLRAITHQYERLAAWGVQLQGEKRIAGHTVGIGAEGYLERMRSPAYSWSPATGAVTLTRPRVPNGARSYNYGLYLQEAWAPERARRLRVSTALRWGGGSYRSRAADSPVVNGAALWPDDSFSDNSLTGRAGAVWRLAGGLSAHGMYSRGFRVPNMTDLGTLGIQGNGFYESSASAVMGRGATVGDRADALARSTGTPVTQLSSETADNWDGGLLWNSPKVRIEGTFFHLRLSNTVVSQTLILPQGAVGQPLGDQIISAQLPTGAVFVPAAVNPVLVRANLGGAVLKGVEQSARLRLTGALTLSQNLTWVEAQDRATGEPPDIEPGTPAPFLNASLLWSPPSRRVWIEAYGTAADRQSRLSSLALADRRIGASRSAASIASFFRNGATVRGFVRDGRVVATGETLAQVQQRVLGGALSAPMFTAIPGYAVLGLRAGFPAGRRSEVMVDFFNLTDKNWRGIGWGVDAEGRGVTLRWKVRL